MTRWRLKVISRAQGVPLETRIDVGMGRSVNVISGTMATPSFALRRHVRCAILSRQLLICHFSRLGRAGEGSELASTLLPHHLSKLYHLLLLCLKISDTRRSDDYSANANKSPLKAILLNKVIVGKGCKMTHDNTTLTAPPAGYDSVSLCPF